MSQFFFTLMVALTLSACAQRLDINGAQLEYEIAGEGEVLVFFDAGALSGLAGWESIWDSLPDGITAIRYSRRGEGRSTRCAEQLHVDDYVADVSEMLLQLGVDRPIVYVAHSLGGTIARAYAARHRGSVAALLLLDPSNPRDVDIITTLNPNGGEEIAQIKAQDYASGAHGWCFLDLMWDKTPMPGLAELGDLPITLIAGVKTVSHPQQTFDTDAARQLWGQYQAEWVAQFPRGRAVVTQNSGHFIQDDEPQRVIRELNRLIALVKHR